MGNSGGYAVSSSPQRGATPCSGRLSGTEAFQAVCSVKRGKGSRGAFRDWQPQDPSAPFTKLSPAVSSDDSVDLRHIKRERVHSTRAAAF